MEEPFIASQPDLTLLRRDIAQESNSNATKGDYRACVPFRVRYDYLGMGDCAAQGATDISNALSSFSIWS